MMGLVLVVNIVKPVVLELLLLLDDVFIGHVYFSLDGFFVSSETFSLNCQRTVRS